jgi:mannose-6-phosphate isomerase-like protein (cupin superfamily)
LPVGQTSLAVAHRTVEEAWYILSGAGEMWRKSGDVETVIALQKDLSLIISCGTHFQFRNTGNTPLKAIGVTMPPWPGMDEAYAVEGKW